MQCMQDRLLLGVFCSPNCSFVDGSGLSVNYTRFLTILGQTSHQSLEEITRNIGDSFQSCGLELFEACMVEDLGNAALQRSTTRPRRHHRTLVRDNVGLDILFGKRQRTVLLKLVLVHLIQS